MRIAGECLAQIQNHVSVLLKMPAEITKDQALAIIEAANTEGTQTGTVNETINIVRHERRMGPNLTPSTHPSRSVTEDHARQR